MKQITLNCQGCDTIHVLDKTPEIPADVFFMKCNWCPHCADTAQGYYEEWWDEDDNEVKAKTITPDPVNQLCMPFIIDEMGVVLKETINN